MGGRGPDSQWQAVGRSHQVLASFRLAWILSWDAIRKSSKRKAKKRVHPSSANGKGPYVLISLMLIELMTSLLHNHHNYVFRLPSEPQKTRAVSHFWASILWICYVPFRRFLETCSWEILLLFSQTRPQSQDSLRAGNKKQNTALNIPDREPHAACWTCCP